MRVERRRKRHANRMLRSFARQDGSDERWTWLISEERVGLGRRFCCRIWFTTSWPSGRSKKRRWTWRDTRGMHFQRQAGETRGPDTNRNRTTIAAWETATDTADAWWLIVVKRTRTTNTDARISCYKRESLHRNGHPTVHTQRARFPRWNIENGLFGQTGLNIRLVRMKCRFNLMD